MRIKYIQTLTYWGNPQSDGYGNFTYDAPVQIKGRWQDSDTLVRDERGQQVRAESEAFVSQTVEPGGYLAVGEHTAANPRDVPEARRIARPSNIFSISGRFRTRKAYMAESG